MPRASLAAGMSLIAAKTNPVARIATANCRSDGTCGRRRRTRMVSFAATSASRKRAMPVISDNFPVSVPGAAAFHQWSLRMRTMSATSGKARSSPSPGVVAARGFAAVRTSGACQRSDDPAIGRTSAGRIEEGWWRARRDSNPRPLGPQPNALSTELRAHAVPAECGGEGGIRTLDAGYPTWRFSKPLH